MKKTFLFPALYVLFLFQLAQPTFGQGWRKTYIFDTEEFGSSLVKSPDGNLIATGTEVAKFDLNGNVLWNSNSEDGSNVEVGDNVIMLEDGGFIVGYNKTEAKTGFYHFDAQGNLISLIEQDISNLATSGSNALGGIDVTPEQDVILGIWFPDFSCPINTVFRLYGLKMDLNGNVIWLKPIGDCGENTRVRAVVALEEGGYVFGGELESNNTSEHSYLIKTDNDGNILWENRESFYKGITALVETNDQNLVMAGMDSPMTSSVNSVFAQKTDLDGNILWTNHFLGFDETTLVTSMVENPNGQFIITGTTGVKPPGSSSIVRRGFLLALDANGDEVWRVVDNFGGAAFEEFNSIVVLDNGNYAIIGSLYGIANPSMLLVMADANGQIYSHQIKGKVFSDSNLDCELSSNETGLSNRVIWATGETDFYAFTDADGNFTMPIDTGNFELTTAPYEYWEQCQASYPIEINTFYDSTIVDLPQQPTINCPVMQVDISTPFLRLCAEGYYAVNYCNQGTVFANDATVEITLADELAFLSAGVPLLSQNGQTLLFDIGDLGISECGYFQLNFQILCDTALFGQTLCTEAHIFPDSICGNTWTGANLEVNGNCEGDSVHFTITNTGGDMPDPFEYIVIEDNIILMTDEFELLENQSFEQAFEASSGATYHLLAAQDPNLPPIFGNTIATASVEGCVGVANPGAFNQFPQDDGEPWLDIDCHEVVASYDPNDKSAVPTGWQEEHFIDENTQLDYLIRFQNTGTDTAFRVVLIDTLSSFLDPATIRPGAGSHPFTFELSGQGVAKFIFENIMLPDSNVNEALSHGFVEFHIAQKPDNQPGTVIQNTAGIYFDFNAPVYTNTTFHTIHEPWVQVVSGSVETFHEEMGLKISPNPIGDWAMIEVENLLPGENTMTLIDGTGREVMQQQFNQNRLLLLRNGLAPGLYFFRIENDGKLVGTGKLVVR